MLPDYAEYPQAIGLDWYEVDPNLALTLDRLLPDPEDRSFAERHVADFGALIGQVLAERAELTDKSGPVLRRYNRFGDDVGEVVHHATWTATKADLVRHGFTGLSLLAERSVPAVLSAALSYLLSQSETAALCALGMTSAAADLVERYGPDGIRDDIVARLRTNDPGSAWEGGMFLTERQGGSDVGANTTQAIPDGDEWRLYGDKHFCSNVDADVFIVLARPAEATTGTRGLATFIVPRHLPDGSANGFTVKRLKPKLGTVGVPTGEVTLAGAKAWLAAPSRGASGSQAGSQAGSQIPDGDSRTASSQAGTREMATSQAGAREEEPSETDPLALARDGKGIHRMMEMVNGSRFGVALMGLGIHRRCFLEAAIYAARREQFGQRIDRYPLVRETLVDLAVGLEAGMALTFECASAVRLGDDPEEARRLRRILIPLAKLRTTRTGLLAAIQALEVFGGNGYMEDFPMARQLRDAQCHTIWEGTENICSLDVRRAMRREAGQEALFARVRAALDAGAGWEGLSGPIDIVAASLQEAEEAVAYLEKAPEEINLLHSRRLAELLADLAEGALLVEEAAWSLRERSDARKALVAHRFATTKLASIPWHGIKNPDRSPLDAFEPLVRYGAVEEKEALALTGR